MPFQPRSSPPRGNANPPWSATKRVVEDNEDGDRAGLVASKPQEPNCTRDFAKELLQRLNITADRHSKRQPLAVKTTSSPNIMPTPSGIHPAEATWKFFHQHQLAYPGSQSHISEQPNLHCRADPPRPTSLDLLSIFGKGPQLATSESEIQTPPPSSKSEPMKHDASTDGDWVILNPECRVPDVTTTFEGQSGKWWYTRDLPRSSAEQWYFIPDKKRSAKSKGKKSKRSKQSKKEKVNFLSLPGEVRNAIYQYLIPECRVLIQRNRPNKESDRQKKVWSLVSERARPRPRLGHLLDRTHADKGFAVTTNLLLTCKQIRTDVERYLYSQTTFCFTSLKNTDRFLQGVSKPGLRAIRRIELFDIGYSNPELAENKQYRDKYYNRWYKICTQIGQELEALEEIKLEAHLRDWPCDLTAGNPVCRWWRACLQLAPRRLPKVKVVLHHNMVQRNRMALKDLARKLENAMMTQKGQEERDRNETLQVYAAIEARKARKAAKHRERKRFVELSITREEIKSQRSTPPKVCKTGLEGYSKLDVSAMSPADHWMPFKDYSHVEACFAT